MDNTTYEDLRKFPHMFPKDIAIWKRYYEKNKDSYINFEYDVKVGSIPQFPENLPPEIYKMGEILWKKRIDVVGYKPDRIEIIEVKPNAGLSAFGQVLGYKLIFEKEKKPALPVVAVLITDYPKQDIASLSPSFGVELVIV